MCGALMECPDDIFAIYFLKDFQELLKDKVINVRMTLSEAIHEHWKKHPDGGLLNKLTVLRGMVRKLKEDKKDVSEILEEVTVQTEEESDKKKNEQD